MLSSVSETALITLKSRIQETKHVNPILSDPMGELCFNNLLNELQDDVKERILKKNLPRTLTSYIALRAKKFDSYTKDFIKKYPDGLVVNLGCGFDTRFWRTGLKENQYIELDLPNVIDIKNEILGDQIKYKILGDSVLDDQWIKTIDAIQNHHVLFLAEGLFMYLQEKDVIKLFNTLAENFTESEVAFETVNKKYTKGFNKKMVEMKIKRQFGSNAGSSYNFGIVNGKEIESYHNKYTVIDEWSFFEEDEVRPKILKLLKRFKTFTRTQWTVKVSIK